MPKPKSKPTMTPKVPPRPSTTNARPRAPRRPSARREAMRQQRNRRWMAIGASVIVVIAVAVLVILKVSSGPTNQSTARSPVTSAQLSRLASIPVGALVGAAQAEGTNISAPAALPSTVPPLTSGGRPEVLYTGAEYCPFCAAERWSIVMALSKFGTFSNLVSTKSSSTDTNPNTPTFSFLGSTYSSPYLTFIPVETEDRNRKPLQTPTSVEAQIIDTYDNTPYTTGTGSIPFVDLGGKYIVSGAEYDGSALAGMSFDNTVTYMADASTTTARAAQGVAAHLIGVICSLTHNQPASVCSAVPASLKTGTAGSANRGPSSSGG